MFIHFSTKKINDTGVHKKETTHTVNQCWEDTSEECVSLHYFFSLSLGAIHSHHTHPADLAGVTHRPEIFTQDESVTVVGNTAEMSKLEEEDTAKAQMNGELPGTANDLQLGIGRPINPEEKQNSLGQNILPSTAKIAKYLPINKVTDFDILDLDLVGLKSLANTGAGQMRHKMRKPKNSNYYTSFAAPLNIGSSSITGTGEASSETGDSIDTGQASKYRALGLFSKIQGPIQI